MSDGVLVSGFPGWNVFVLEKERIHWEKNVREHPLEGLVVEPGPGGHSWDRPLRERIKEQSFWRDLVILFVVFSLLGHWLEILFCRLIEAGIFMGEMDYTNAMLWNQW